MRVYLAGPITGKGFAEVSGHFAGLKSRLERCGYQVLHPMLGKDHLRTETTFRPEGYTHPVTQDHAIFERDQWMVTKQVDIVLADLSQATRVSIGTCYELAWASLAGVHTVVVLPDDNPHRHCFVTESADIIFEALGDAVMYLESLGVRA